MTRKFTKVFFVLLLCFIFKQSVFSQTSKIWDKSFGGNNSDLLITTVATKDNGFLLGGTSSSSVNGTKSTGNKGLQDYWLVKTNGDGNEQWDKTFGGSGSDFLQAAWQTADGGYILGGSSNSPVSGDKSIAASSQYDYWIIKLDASGNKQWDKSFGGSSNDYLKSVVATRDGGYLLGGTSDSPVSGKTGYNKTAGSKGLQDYWLVKVDANGNKQWDKSFGGSSYDYLQTIQTTNDNGFIVAGYSYSSGSGDKSAGSKGFADYWIVKVDASGNKQWDRTYGGNQEENLETCLSTSDGGYLLGGISNSPASADKSEGSNGLSDYWLVKIDGSGNKKWEKTYGGNNNDYLQAITQTYDNGFLLGGASDSPVGGDKSTGSKGESDYWIVKIDAAGNKQWNRTFGGEGYDNLQALQLNNTGGCLLSGTSNSGAGSDKNSSNRGDTDFWMINLDLGGPDMPPVINQEVESFTLLNADTDTDIQTLASGAILNLATLPTKNLNIRANTNITTIGSVIFNLSGAQDLTRTESGAPFAAFGATGNNYNAWVPAIGNYTLKATPATNGQTGTSLTVNFQVVNQTTNNQAPVASAGSNSTVYLPATSTTLNGSGSDADGNIASFLWAQASGPNTATFSSKTVAKPTVSNLVAGTYVFSLIVKDNNNTSSNPAQVSITVSNSSTSDQQILGFTLLNADSDTDIQTITNGATLNLGSLPTKRLNIRVNTSTNTIGVAFALKGAETLNRSEATAPYIVFGASGTDYNAWSPTVGNYTLQATPYSKTTGATTGAALTINFQVVNQTTGNQIPIASAGANSTMYLPTSSIILNGSGTDADGSIASYLWAQASGPNTATFSSKSVAKPTVSNLVAGTYVFSLIVKDNSNASSNPSQVAINVSNSTTAGQKVVSYTLMNADTDKEIRTISNGSILNLATLPTKNLNIRANTNPEIVGSVVMVVSGKTNLSKTETAAPYAVFGDVSGNYSAWIPTLGDYTLKTTPYTLAKGAGTAGTPLTISFKVVNVAGSSSIDTSYSTGTDSLAVEDFPDEAYPNEDPTFETVSLTNFPNPFQDQTTIQFSFPEEQDYTLEIYDLTGSLVNQLKTGIAPACKLIEATWDSSHQDPGMYIVRLISGHEVQHLQILLED
ncbi:PKD domain-containing protein [Adhaeribacter radiodurans]|uniref:T9SS type A sorting domain-containing protein n=1 Tax=Adhaeribacter radiodurans TaxID=2745197 RepID=A0A7L7LC33_9BACT|nr:T9SS type A sorting domain-containing protein [Adhaeribacter radiodurans]QMU30381.1 T9SS type A sorting domain-containing protein [Adhaeribacter radiodurans]